jgi:hypothetical protein
MTLGCSRSNELIKANGCLTCLTIRSIKELMIQPGGDFLQKHKNFLRAKIGSEF